MRSPWQRAAPRSMTFSSSRTLPGQAWALSRAMASSEKSRMSLPMRGAARPRKNWASRGMSSRRSARGGRWRLTTLRRNQRSWRKRPSLIQALRSRLLAARKRTSTRRGRVAPRGRTSRSWMTRSSLACMAGDISEISSRKRVPPSAAAIRPPLPTAPVKAPFSWPKSSLARSSSLKAAQLMARKGPWGRGPCSWTKRARTSLPVPDSPVMRTLQPEGAICRAMSRSLCMAPSRVTRRVLP